MLIVPVLLLRIISVIFWPHAAYPLPGGEFQISAREIL
jgi:hypothetical protein